VDATRSYILVVDDLADAADSLAELLSLWGYDADPLYGGAAALAAARTRRPGAVLLDLGMPGMTGLQFALRLRDVPGCGATPVVAVTGHPGLTPQAREVGIDHYLLKPVMDLGLLRELLGRLTGSTEPPSSRTAPGPGEGPPCRTARTRVTRSRTDGFGRPVLLRTGAGP
jgi:CheY-like chemotaxis protein